MMRSGIIIPNGFLYLHRCNWVPCALKRKEIISGLCAKAGYEQGTKPMHKVTYLVEEEDWRLDWADEGYWEQKPLFLSRTALSVRRIT